MQNPDPSDSTMVLMGVVGCTSGFVVASIVTELWAPHASDLLAVAIIAFFISVPAFAIVGAIVGLTAGSVVDRVSTRGFSAANSPVASIRPRGLTAPTSRKPSVQSSRTQNALTQPWTPRQVRAYWSAFWITLAVVAISVSILISAAEGCHPFQQPRCKPRYYERWSM